MPSGRIIKALSGFYYVESEGEIFQCKGRGVFRKKKITPLVGDVVTFDISGKNEGYILEIHPRDNELIRPPIANINQAIIVCSAMKPVFSTVLLDRFLVLVESKGIKPVIFITKMDLVADEAKNSLISYQKDYERVGYKVEQFSVKDSSVLASLEQYFTNNITVIAGQSGVGKTSLLNAINPSLLLKTDEISDSLGRGKHTTRHVELISLCGGLVADTPGFSSLDFQDIEPEELAACFPEIRDRMENCKFRGCMHYKEPKCAIKQAVESGEIASYRYQHYLRFLEEIQSRKPRY
ncbi:MULTISPECIES: ribosome small subunit-dependent GTPase A [Virgibacillus]|uniref:Small ribosomal subunit biogenesis GTPase RsgA n=1 Tax=Virgibacillus salarius TaxID=447199 RepID=A0A941IAE7_9BACI|nr:MULTISPECIES: ribosome small subunit-dependent GTPase A [Virgibacillus]MBR7795287.1 ribosome small subunit-dependent GTPase A [Virgibacillus salarius]NAZ08002.1 ribosome small subunit-dependent GTPase A [Agaribacter marinus]WBX79613.1 ribosome small subunit-dependent GTPase A [Virgibacillus salarius]